MHPKWIFYTSNVDLLYIRLLENIPFIFGAYFFQSPLHASLSLLPYPVFFTSSFLKRYFIFALGTIQCLTLFLSLFEHFPSEFITIHYFLISFSVKSFSDIFLSFSHFLFLSLIDIHEAESSNELLNQMTVLNKERKKSLAAIFQARCFETNLSFFHDSKWRFSDGQFPANFSKIQKIFITVKSVYFVIIGNGIEML